MLADDCPCLWHRKVGLPNVHATSSRHASNVSAVVDDDDGADLARSGDRAFRELEELRAADFFRSKLQQPGTAAQACAGQRERINSPSAAEARVDDWVNGN